MSWFRRDPDPTVVLLLARVSDWEAARQQAQTQTIATVMDAVKALAEVARLQTEAARALADTFTYKGESMDRRIATPELDTLKLFEAAGLVGDTEADAYRQDLKTLLDRERT